MSGLPDLDPEFVANAERQIRLAIDNIRDGFGKPDLETACAPYVRDESYLLFDVYPPLFDRGYENLYRKNKEYIDSIDGTTELHWTDEFIEVGRDLAYFYGLLHCEARIRDGRRFGGTFRHTLVFRRFDDRWLVVHEHNSMPSEAIDVEPVAAARRSENPGSV